LAALTVSSCANAQVSDNLSDSFKSTTSSTSPAVKRYKRPVLEPSKPLLIVYPNTEGTAKIAASSSFLIGSTYPGFSLTVNGEKVLTNKEGFFAHVVPLTKGKNKFEVKVSGSDGSQTYSQVVEIAREGSPQSLSPSSFEFVPHSFEPKEDRGLNVGEIIEFAVRATPGSQVHVFMGKKQIALASIASLKSRKAGTTHSGINRGLEAAYGQVFQRHPAAQPDLYVGLYRIEANDQFYQEHPRYVMQKEGKSLTVASPAAITVLRQPQIAHTIHKDTITRVAPDLARLTPLPEGVRLIVDGYQGENIRCRYAPNKHIWIKKEDLSLGDSSGPAPDSVARTIQVKEDSYGETVVIPLNQRLPFLVEQNLKTNHLNVKIYGALADTDWVYQAPEGGNSKLIENISWKQPEDGVYQVDIDLAGARQWGYFADFEDNNLNLHIKYPPRLRPITEEASMRLQGLRICLDPGHGGKETGAIGPSAIREAEINLAIALKFRDLLVAEGATVYMTREGDVEVSLNDRVDFAKAKNVDLLISIHNNALPDGRDPNKEHGTSSYWYHPQSQELAASLKNAEAKELGFPDIGARYQNLALCRPTNMPAVLVEVGFVCNPDEYAKLISPASQQAAAQGMLKGLINYFAKK
jgi:N-acetylmuramoyl-L-alanine amidase